MKTFAKYRYARSSAQKVRLVIKLIKNKNVLHALEILHFTNKKAAMLIKITLNSAIANAINNYKSNINDLYIKKIFVDEGPTSKRMMPRAKGRSDRILKRTSHITIVLISKTIN